MVTHLTHHHYPCKGHRHAGAHPRRPQGERWGQSITGHIHRQTTNNHSHLRPRLQSVELHVFGLWEQQTRGEHTNQTLWPATGFNWWERRWNVIGYSWFELLFTFVLPAPLLIWRYKKPWVERAEEMKAARVLAFVLCCLCFSDQWTATVIWTGLSGELRQASRDGEGSLSFGGATLPTQTRHTLGACSSIKHASQVTKHTRTLYTYMHACLPARTHKHTHTARQVQAGSALPGEIMWCTVHISRVPLFTQPRN